MSTTDKGVLIFYEWLAAMKKLSAKDFKQLMLAVCDYQLNGTKPPEFKGKSEMMASVIFPCLDRRLAQSMGGKKAMQLRKIQRGINPVIDELLSGRIEEDPDN